MSERKIIPEQVVKQNIGSISGHILAEGTAHRVRGLVQNTGSLPEDHSGKYSVWRAAVRLQEAKEIQRKEGLNSSDKNVRHMVAASMHYGNRNASARRPSR